MSTKRKSISGTVAKKTKRSVPYEKKYQVQKPGVERTGGYYGRYNNSIGMGSVEKKFFDTQRAFQIPAITGTVLNPSLNLIPQGTTESTRVGRKIMIKNLYLHGEIELPATATAASTGDIVRMIVYIDKQCNGATINITDLLEDNSAAVDVNSFRKLANQERFVVLKDKMYPINSSSGGLTGNSSGYSVFNIKVYKKLDLPVEFSAAMGAITEIKSNNIGVICVSSKGLARVAYTSRVRYTDN